MLVVLLIVGALYGLKSAGFSWQSELCSALKQCGFKDSQADPNVWIREARCVDRYEYYEMLLTYVDNVLIISHQGDTIAKQIGQIYKIKEGSQGPPKIYLGANNDKIQTDDGQEIWAMSLRTYVKEAVATVEKIC